MKITTVTQTIDTEKEIAFPSSQTFNETEMREVSNKKTNIFVVHSETGFCDPDKYHATSLKALKVLLNKVYSEGARLTIYKQVNIYKGHYFITQ